MNKTNTKAKVGRPETVLPVIRKNSLHFRNLTPMEFTEKFFNEARPLMKNGVDGDERKQKNTFYQLSLRYRNQAVKEGKKIGFQGRKVNGETKTAYIHTTKQRKDQA